MPQPLLKLSNGASLTQVPKRALSPPVVTGLFRNLRLTSCYYTSLGPFWLEKRQVLVNIDVENVSVLSQLAFCTRMSLWHLHLPIAGNEPCSASSVVLSVGL